MDTISVLTLRLAEAIGLYMIVLGIGGLVAPQRWRAMIDDLDRSPGLTITLGFALFATGTAMVLSHHALSDPLAIIVTVAGHIALIEGALLIAVPAPLIALGRRAMRFARAFAIASLVLGILLFLAGLTGRASLLA